MTTYARREAGRIVEVFPPAFYPEDVVQPPVDLEGSPVVLHSAGDEIPIADRFHPDFVATLEVVPDGTEPDEPEAPSDSVVIPLSVSMRQARLALLAAGLLDEVEGALDAIPDPTQRTAARIDWDYAATVERDSPTVSMLADALSLSDEALDALFTDAAAR